MRWKVNGAMRNYPRANCLCVPIILDIPRRGRSPPALHYSLPLPPSLPPSLSLSRARVRAGISLSAAINRDTGPRRAPASRKSAKRAISAFPVLSLTLSLSLPPPSPPPPSLSLSLSLSLARAAEFARATRDRARDLAAAGFRERRAPGIGGRWGRGRGGNGGGIDGP